MAMTYEGPVQPISSHEEELAHLRAQVEAKERELTSMKQNRPREEIVRERLTHHLKTPAESVLAPAMQMAPQEIHELALNLDPESDDATMEELRKVMEERGIHNAFAVLAKLQSPHLEDDFHRFLIAYIAKGLPPKGLSEGQPQWKSLHMTLYEISLPEPHADPDKDERYKHFKELVSAMEQVYSGMLAVEHPFAGEPAYYTFELAVPTDDPHLRFYASVPNSRCHLFEKTLLGVFPSAIVVVQPNDYNIFAQDGYALASSARLYYKHPLSLSDYSDFEADPMNGLLSSFSKIQEEGQGAAVQFIIKPADNSYQKGYRKIVKALRDGEHRDRALEISDHFLPEMFRELKWLFRPAKKDREKHSDEASIKSVERKQKTPIVETNIRVLASTRDVQHTTQMLQELEATFNNYESPTGNRLIFKQPSGGALKRLFKNFSWRLFSHEENMPLSISEITTMYHFPPKGVKGTPHLKQSRFTQAAAPLEPVADGILLGVNNYRGQETSVKLAPLDRARHLYMVGQTGTGKSSFMKILIEQDIKAGNGVCFIDPHGNDILDVLASIPPERYEDVIYFDPAHIDRPFGLNMLEYDPRLPEQKSFIVNELLMIFRQLYGDVPESMGPAFEQYFRNATQLVMEDPASGSTMLDIGRVLSNAEFRNRKLARSNNLIVNNFWTEIATRAEGEASLANIVPYITNKFDEFTANDFMRPIIGQQESSFNFREVMDNKKILLVNLSKGRLGERNANLLGLITVGKLFMAALSRADSPGKDFPPFYLYIDEFQNITTTSIPGILSEARKYKLSLTIAHQFLKQIDEKIRDAVFGNVGSMAIFRVGEEDGEFFAKQFAPVFQSIDFVNIENFNAYVRILAGGVPQKPFNIKIPPPLPGNKDQVDDLRELSYLTYGRDREQVESLIRSRYLS